MLSDKIPDFITQVSRMLGALIYAITIGWKLSLVYLSISPLIIIGLNMTIRVLLSS